MIVQRSAEFSPCGGHRHQLDRWWGVGPRVLVCMANPSIASDERDDPTIRRVIELCRRICNGVTVVNYEDRIATDPLVLNEWVKKHLSGSGNEAYLARRAANRARIRTLSATAAVRIAAWGNLCQPDPGFLEDLSLGHAYPIYCWGRTLSGQPKHPMARGRHRIADDQWPMVWMTGRDAIGARPAAAAVL